jgi:hypothetical protein
MDTTGYLFTGSSDLMVGQEVSVLRNASLSSGTSLTADRVLLRASRISATVSRTACPDFTLTNLPSIFGAAGTSQITVFTSTSASNGITEFAGTAKGCTQMEANGTAIVPVRGQLFSISGGGLPTLVASKVIAP